MQKQCSSVVCLAMLLLKKYPGCLFRGFTLIRAGFCDAVYSELAP